MFPLSLLVSLACTNGAGDSDSAVELPTLRFLAPDEGAVVEAGTVQVSLIAEHVVLVEQTARAVPPLLWLVDASLEQARAHEDGSTPEGSVALSLDGVQIQVLSGTTATLSDVAAGAHRLDAGLLDAEGAPWSPEVAASVEFTAQ